jgi:hypothetical protein
MASGEPAVTGTADALKPYPVYLPPRMIFRLRRAAVSFGLPESGILSEALEAWLSQWRADQP